MAVQWLNQALCFNKCLCLVDCEVILSRHLREVVNRYQLFNPTIMYKKYRLLFLMLISITLIGCDSYRNQLVGSGDKDQAILNAVIDFSNTSNLDKKYSVFYVTYYDTLYKKELEKVSDRNYNWINAKSYKDIIAVTITGDDYKYELSAIDVLESNGILPTKYIEADGKLFIWRDETKSIDEKTISLYKKYNLLVIDAPGTITIDETAKGAHYYFCRKNLKKYKKKLSNIAIGYYDAPKINCD
jgi:hypothetical protein